MKKSNPVSCLLPVILLLIDLTLFNCGLTIQFGKAPPVLDAEIPYEQGELTYINKKNKEIKLKYIVTQPDLSKPFANDLIFFFHGISGTELDWVEKDSYGKIFYNTIQAHPQSLNYTVVSISFGKAFLFLNDLPRPYYMDLEDLFIREVVPHFKNMLHRNGKVYLIGHSMGGYNTLTLALRHPDLFGATVSFSPFVASLSPFQPEFEKKGTELKMPQWLIHFLKDELTSAFINEQRWYEYNPFTLVEKNNKHPYLIFSTTDNDLPGFTESIIAFHNTLKSHNVQHTFCAIPGTHSTVCSHAFESFLAYIQEGKT